MQAFDGIGVERYVWIVFQQFTAYPTFYSGSTVSATDDADRNPEGTAQRSGKIVGRRTEIGCGFYGRYVPATFAVGLRFISLVLGNGKQIGSVDILTTEEVQRAGFVDYFQEGVDAFLL